MINIDTNLISNWNLEEALNVVFRSFNNEKNIKNVGLYESVDEKDVLELVYYILKYSKGTKIPTNKDIESLAIKLSSLRLINKEIETKHYSMRNGEMTDIHLLFFLEKIFEPYSDRLHRDYGFNHRIIKKIKLFFGFHRSLVFTVDDVKKYATNAVCDPNFLCEFTRFINYFSGEASLDNFIDFQKGVSKKPFIKLTENKYIFFWHWFRTSAISNFHYLLAEDESYKKHKGDIFEKITVDLFKHHLKVDEIYSSVSYNSGEIDVLVDMDDVILLVECKSGILYEDYKLGTINDKVMRNIDSIIGKAKKQLSDAKGALQSKVDLIHQNSKLDLDTSKNILLLNVCFEFPIGLSNKDKDEEVISLTLVDLMMITDIIVEEYFGKPKIKNIVEYLALRRKALGIATDDEIVIAISLLYSEYIDAFIKNNALGILQIDSSKSMAELNELYSTLEIAKLFPDSRKYTLVKNNYKGFLYDYVIRNDINDEA